MRNEITTTDLSKFGWREWTLAAELLNAMVEGGLPDEFENDEITIMFNTYSGNVFLTNSEYQVAMMNGDKLEMFNTCTWCGNEGFADEIDIKDGLCSNCANEDEAEG